jgi:hypothetical protein
MREGIFEALSDPSKALILLNLRLCSTLSDLPVKGESGSEGA